MVAESDDDLSTLPLPADHTAPASVPSSPQDETKSGIDRERSSESQAEAPPSSKGEDVPFSSRPEGSQPPVSSSESPSESSERPLKQIYPLYPSITQLLHQNSLPVSDADKIPASGPKGRLLKGDVLAYLGTISKSYSSDQSNRISRLGHLDLSSIKIAPPKEAPPPPATTGPSEVPPAGEVEQDTEIAVTVSMSSVLEVQRRVQSNLGITLPLSTFIARATEVANDDLPRSSSSEITADELFDMVLGIKTVGSKTSRGSFTPEITALPPTPMASRRPRPKSTQLDIIDILTGQPSATTRRPFPKPPSGIMAASAPGGSTNLLSINVPKGEEKRAKVFLERVKTILQVEPGRLIV